MSSSQDSLGNRTSIFSDTLLRLAQDPQLLDPVSVRSLPTFPCLEAIASRCAVTCVTQCTGHSSILGSVGMKHLTLVVTSGNGVESLSSVDATTCAVGAQGLANQLGWAFAPAAISPGGPVWKFQGEFENVLSLCERALPQRRRIKFILEEDVTSEGRQRFPEPVESHRKELESAEGWVFRSSVLQAVTTELLEDLEDEESGQVISEGLESPLYVNASTESKKHHIGNMLCHRLAVLHDKMGRDNATKDDFLKHVLGIWLHMLNFSGQLVKETLSGPPGTKYFETPYDLYSVSEEYFAEPIANLLPDVLAYFSEHAGS
jgi:hypothetical protein